MAGLTKEQRAEREAQKLAELQQQEGAAVSEDVEHAEAADDVVEDVAGQDESSPEAQQDDDEHHQENAIAYVTMVRDPGKYDAPHTAQVHPDEVVNYYSGGWVEDK